METIVKCNHEPFSIRKVFTMPLIIKGIALLLISVLYVVICYKIAGLRKDGAETIFIDAISQSPETDNTIYFIITLAVPFVAFTILYYLQKLIKVNTKGRNDFLHKKSKESVYKQILDIKENEHTRLLKELTEARKIHDHQNLDYIKLIESSNREWFIWREKAYADANNVQHHLTKDSETLDIAAAKLEDPSIYFILVNKLKEWIKGKTEPEKLNGKDLHIQGLDNINRTYSSNTHLLTR